jgi:hypothetical protein
MSFVAFCVVAFLTLPALGMPDVRLTEFESYGFTLHWLSQFVITIPAQLGIVITKL